MRPGGGSGGRGVSYRYINACMPVCLFVFLFLFEYITTYGTETGRDHQKKWLMVCVCLYDGTSGRAGQSNVHTHSGIHAAPEIRDAHPAVLKTYTLWSPSQSVELITATRISGSHMPAREEIWQISSCLCTKVSSGTSE